MTDEEYMALLRALAAKHLRLPRGGFAEYAHTPPTAPRARWYDQAQDAYALARLLNAVAVDPAPDVRLLEVLGRRLQQASPLRTTTSAMDDVGILDALEDAPLLVFGEFRRSAFPDEDIEILRRAGFTSEEIEVLIPTIVLYARHIGHLTSTWSGVGDNLEVHAVFLAPSRVLQDAATALDKAADKLAGAGQVAPVKKRKLFNGIGKLLAGSVMGIGNALVATGAVLAPNPATGAIAIGSGAGAIGSIMAGIGDLRGE